MVYRRFDYGNGGSRSLQRILFVRVILFLVRHVCLKRRLFGKVHNLVALDRRF